MRAKMKEQSLEQPLNGIISMRKVKLSSRLIVGESYVWERKQCIVCNAARCDHWMRSFKRQSLWVVYNRGELEGEGEGERRKERLCVFYVL